MRLGLSKQSPRHVAEHPDKMPLAITPYRGAGHVPGERHMNPWKAHGWHCACQVLKHPTLQVDQPAIIAGAHQLEHKGLTVPRHSVEIGVVFARQRGKVGPKSIKLPENVRGVFLGEC